MLAGGDEVKFFRRVEQKYILDKNTYEKLLQEIEDSIIEDKYFYSEICSVYFDTDKNNLIINAMEKPIYKEKFRLRSYGVATMNDKVFLEIKKKFKEETSKRRVEVTLKDFWNYYHEGIFPLQVDEEIMKEIDYGFKKYCLVPKLFICYERYSYCGKKDKNLRITFDFNMQYRKKNLNLLTKDNTKFLVERDVYIMEIKTLDSIPLWLIRALDRLKIYPMGFSKYKEAYIKDFHR